MQCDSVPCVQKWNKNGDNDSNATRKRLDIARLSAEKSGKSFREYCHVAQQVLKENEMIEIEPKQQEISTLRTSCRSFLRAV